MGLGKNQTSASSSVGWKLLLVAGSADLVQPTVVRREGKPLFRDRRAEHVYSAESEDDGVTWSTPSPPVLPNNNAGIEAYTLKNSSIVMAFNPQTKGRDPLAVGISHDGGVTWPQQRYLQHGTSGGSENGNEFSYPTILQTDDGIIHCLFTYLRQTIKYKRFSASWISGGNVTY